MAQEPTDHDLLIRIDERVRKLTDCLAGHLEHHWAVALMAGGALLSGVIALIVSLYKGC